MPSASIGTTWVRHPPPAQHAAAPQQSQSALHASWTPSRNLPCASQRMRSTRWLEGCRVGLKCSVQHGEKGGCCRLACDFGVNPLAMFVITAYQNRSLPKLTCSLCSSAWVFVYTSRYRKTKITTSDKPVCCSIYLHSDTGKSNGPASLSSVSNGSPYSREPGMLDAQGLRLRTQDLHPTPHRIILDDPKCWNFGEQ